MSAVYATLPREITLDGLVHLLHWKTRNHAVYQSYTLPRATSDQPIQDRTPQILGANWFKVFAIIQHSPGEELSAPVAMFGDLQSAMNWIEREERA